MGRHFAPKRVAGRIKHLNVRQSKLDCNEKASDGLTHALSAKELEKPPPMLEIIHLPWWCYVNMLIQGGTRASRGRDDHDGDLETRKTGNPVTRWATKKVQNVTRWIERKTNCSDRHATDRLATMCGHNVT